MKKLFAFALLCMAFSLSAASAAEGVAVEDAWIREAPPGAPMLAGYLTLNNPSDEDRALVSAESPDFGMVELHRTVLKDGMARMVAQKQVPVPAGGQTVLKPGDYHLMLMKPKRSLRAGDQATFVLGFDDGSEITVQAEVRRAAMQNEMDHGHSHDGQGHHSH